MARRKKSAGKCANAGESWRIFESVSDFAAAAQNVPDYLGDGASATKWAGGSLRQAFELLSAGDTDAVADAERKINNINDALSIAGARLDWVPDVCGAFANVPAMLAGSPLSMWRRDPVHDDRGEISVYVNTAVSCSVSAADMARRGVCVLAALLALSRVRSVRLCVYASMHGEAVGVRCSYPFDISEVCALITRPVITRRCFYSFGEAAGSGGKWAAWSAVKAGEGSERAEVLRAFGDDGRGVVISPHKLGSLAGLTDEEFIAKINGLLEAVQNGEKAEF